MTPDRTDPTLSTAEYATAGFISAIPQTFVAAPVERAKVLLQVMRFTYHIIYTFILLSRSKVKGVPSRDIAGSLMSLGDFTRKAAFAVSSVELEPLLQGMVLEVQRKSQCLIISV